MKYINCKQYAQEILDEVKAIPNKKKLVIISVGEDEASHRYVRGKIKDAEYCDIPYEHIQIADDNMAALNLLATITENNLDKEVGGIILQLPLPESLDNIPFWESIAPEKDVDGLTKDSYFKPCTPKGIVHLLEKELGDLTGKNALVIGRSILVGMPLAEMLLDKDCTVMVAHSKTDRNWLRRRLHDSDIVVSAVGKPEFLDLEDCWDAEIVVDVGINRDANGKLCGDCYEFDEYENPTLKVTPVPGGVGLLTRAMLMKNVAEASQMD